MNNRTSFNILLMVFLLITFLSAGTGAAQTNTAVGTGALTHQSSNDLFDSAFGYNALSSPTSGTNNTANGAAALLSNSTGFNNTASGAFALQHNTMGGANTADGATALLNNTTGYDNTATGVRSLFSNTTGFDNVASGFDALGRNTTGFENTASGYGALAANTTGAANTACGFQALFANTTGGGNTATGYRALEANTTGTTNTADGRYALNRNTTGLYNTATGSRALFANTTGGYGIADGVNALSENTTGQQDTAVGVNALARNTTGNSNLALGYQAGYNLTTGSGNVDIANPGVAAESNTIRIGNQGTQTATFIAGVFGSPLTGDPVMVSSTGKLGIVVSSARYKRDVHDMDAASSNLMRLRPVTFRYKSDPGNIKQYGLIAEEVARVYPELVSYGADGKVQTVNYLTLTSMLLNELQKQAREMVAIRVERDRVRAERAAFEARLSRLERTMAAAEGNHNLATACNR
jgi:trimeric autotransporter adhesin